MKEGRIDLGANDILQFVGIQLSDLEDDLRLIEGAILAAAAGQSSNRRVIQNLDRCLQILQDLSRVCAAVCSTGENERIAAHQISMHLRLGHLKAQILGASPDMPDQSIEPDFFD